MKLTVVGCSPAWPNPGGAQSGYLVEAHGRLLLDCGPGVLARLRELEMRLNSGERPWPRLDAIVITHFHLDHWGDLVPWVWGSMYLGRERAGRPQLWVPPGGVERLREFGSRLGWDDMFERIFEIREYHEGEPFETAGVTVEAIQLPHYALETFGLRVANERRSLAYSGDSGPSDRLARLARDVDLFVCEATLLRGDLDGQPRGHLSVDEAVHAFEASGARRLLLTHRPDELPVDEGLELAYDGLELEL